MAIDLKKIIDQKGLDPKKLALQLFPSHAEPDRALKRILKGDQVLDASQISKLAFLTGLSYDDIFKGKAWRSISSGDVMVFENGDYTAELDLKHLTTKVYHKGGLFHDTVLHSGAIRLSEYLNFLNNLINIYQNEAI